MWFNSIRHSIIFWQIILILVIHVVSIELIFNLFNINYWYVMSVPIFKWHLVGRLLIIFKLIVQIGPICILELWLQTIVLFFKILVLFISQIPLFTLGLSDIEGFGVRRLITVYIIVHVLLSYEDWAVDVAHGSLFYLELVVSQTWLFIKLLRIYSKIFIYAKLIHSLLVNILYWIFHIF